MLANPQSDLRASGFWSWGGRGYFLVLVTALASSALLLATGLRPSLSAGVVVLHVALMLGALERWVPHRRSWLPDQKLFRLDLLHTLVSSQGVAPLVRTGWVAAAAGIGAFAGGRGLAVWPNQWPLAAQVLLAIPIADFGVYWAHRFLHQSEFGWRLHAVHHSPTRMYFMASARAHPFNAIITVSCQFGVLLLLGIGEEALSLWAVFLAVNGLLQHANIDFQPGALSRVLATCDVHRAHHSRDGEPCNFGNMTMIWDQVFRTYRMPPPHSEEVGAGGYDIPEDYRSHMIVPFILPRFEETAPAHMHADHQSG